MEKRAEVMNHWLEERVQTVLPMLMERADIDMWVIIAREYNEDPVIKTMLPATWQSARRTTMLIAYNPGNGKPIETFGMSRYNTGDLFKTVWNKEEQPNQWKALADMIMEKNPRKIGINKSETFALADGLSATHHDQLMEVLPKKYQDRVVSAENLAISWLETRTQSEMVVYRNVMRIAHQIIAEGLSEKVILPGVTSTNDVAWWYRDRINELGFTAWFHPIVDVQRMDPETSDSKRSFSRRPDQQIIQPGDIVHIDVGITYLGLNTDTQQNAYILRPNEMSVPPFIVDAYQKGNRVQDILTSHFVTGRTGNEILKKTLDQCKSEGLKGVIYTHPIGYHGHGAGPTIGLWDQQGGVQGKGDYPLYPNTAYSIELNTGVFLEEWNTEIRVMLEEEAFFDGEKVYYIDGRQTELMTIPRTLWPNE